MWLRMHGVPPISPSAKKQRNAFTDARLLHNTNPSVESRKSSLIWLRLDRLHNQSQESPAVKRCDIFIICKSPLYLETVL
jgi:hypothetical protein